MNNLEIREVTGQTMWEDFVLKHAPQSLFQSWLWGEVTQRIDFFWRLGIFQNSALVGIAQVEKIVARRGIFLELRHGPILKEWKKEYFTALLEELKKYGKVNSASFIRISPLIADDQKNHDFLKNYGFRPSPIHAMNAELCWVVDLSKSEEELLANMRKTTRYSIRQAEKIGVAIQESSDIDAFMKLYSQTALRHGFVPHQQIVQEFQIFNREQKALLLLGTYQEDVLAGALILFYGNQAIYHHGASLSNKIPASYLIQWYAMKRAKQYGCQTYNFWGIAPVNKPKHPWQGLTLFKKGFGGYEQHFLHAHDFPLSWKYAASYAIETFRRIRRGY